MKIFGICLVKNEGDIIAQTLEFATRYCDKIFVIDNGSTDATWEIVQDIGRGHRQVIPFTQTEEPYDDGLRWLAYDRHHRELSGDDWWLVLDGDEFLAEDPRTVIAQATAEGADIVNAWQIQFYYTEQDYQSWLAGEDDRRLPIFKRRRYYRIDWQEPRLFRNTPCGGWEGSYLRRKLPPPPWWPAREASAGTERVGRTARRRILNRHFQYRDPDQIENRLALRYGKVQFRSQVASTDWRSVMRPSDSLHYHRDDEPWRFSVSGLAHFYGGLLKYGLRSRVWRPLTRNARRLSLPGRRYKAAQKISR